MAPLPWVTGDILSVLRLAVFLLHCRDFFFSSLVWSAGDKLLFFLCPCCRAGSCQPWAPGFIPWLLTHDVMLAGPFHFPLALLALL